MLLTVTVNGIPFPLPEQDTHKKQKQQKKQKEHKKEKNRTRLASMISPILSWSSQNSLFISSFSPALEEGSIAEDIPRAEQLTRTVSKTC